MIPKEKTSANSGSNSPIPSIFPSLIYFNSGDIYIKVPLAYVLANVP